MTSDVFVWVWLPGQRAPVVCGRLRRFAGGLFFQYGRSYLGRSNAISLDAINPVDPALPMDDEWHLRAPVIGKPSAIKDAAPDGWGERVIWNATGSRDMSSEFILLASGTDRIGGIDFQASATEYRSRTDNASLADLLTAASRVDSGQPLPPSLAIAIQHGTSVGGARPKALLRDGNESWLAKFSSSNDQSNVVGAEAASIWLARESGIDVPEARMECVLGKDVLLSRRFDRPGGGERRLVVTGITMLGYDLGMIPRGSYPELVDILRRNGDDVGGELFSRVAFAVATTNTDDHMRNHSAFWDGKELRLTPAYDLSPGSRTGDTATLTTPYSRSGRKDANFASLAACASEFGVSASEAHERIEKVRSAISDNWAAAADFARLTSSDRKRLWHRQFLHRSTAFGWNP